MTPEMFKEARVYRNIRMHEDDFVMRYPCDYCKEFVSQVVSIPLKNSEYDYRVWICKGCLTELIQQLDQNMQNNFQPDFEKSRKEYSDETCFH